MLITSQYAHKLTLRGLNAALQPITILTEYPNKYILPIYL